MNDLIKIENGSCELTQNAIDYIVYAEKRMKTFKEEYDKFKADLLKAMKKTNTIKFEDKVNGLRINYIAEADREVFDSKQFREDFPDLYDSYVKFSKVKPSIRIKVD